MAWFISPGIPGLVVNVPGRPPCVFVSAEYNTVDPQEIAALRADPRCQEAFQKGYHKKLAPKPPESQRPWVVDENNNLIHHLDMAGFLCDLPAELKTTEFEQDAPWVYKHYRLYRRLSDAKRWNRGASMCPHCASAIK